MLFLYMHISVRARVDTLYELYTCTAGAVHFFDSILMHACLCNPSYIYDYIYIYICMCVYSCMHARMCAPSYIFIYSYIYMRI